MVFSTKKFLNYVPAFKISREHFEDPFCSTTVEILSEKVATGKGLGVSWKKNATEFLQEVHADNSQYLNSSL